MAQLNIDDLSVTTFETDGVVKQMSAGGGGYCCTGCTTGCGINPTAGGCESGSGDVFCEGGDTVQQQDYANY